MSGLPLWLAFLLLCFGALSKADTFDQLGYSGGGSRGEFHFGKDAELFFASIDLKWLWNEKIVSLSRKETWSNLFYRITNRLHRLEGAYDTLYTYREKAMDILLSIRHFNTTSTLRVFQNSLKSAAAVSMESKRFVLFYMEEEHKHKHKHIIQSVETYAYRKALSENPLTTIINDKFLFMASISDHTYSKGVIKLLELKDPVLNEELEYPLLVILSPLPLQKRRKWRMGLGTLFGRSTRDQEMGLEILATLGIDLLEDIDSHIIAKFLNKAASLHSSRFTLLLSDGKDHANEVVQKTALAMIDPSRSGSGSGSGHTDSIGGNGSSSSGSSSGSSSSCKNVNSNSNSSSGSGSSSSSNSSIGSKSNSSKTNLR